MFGLFSLSLPGSFLWYIVILVWDKNLELCFPLIFWWIPKWSLSISFLFYLNFPLVHYEFPQFPPSPYLPLSIFHTVICLLQAFADMSDLFSSHIQSHGEMWIMSESLRGGWSQQNTMWAPSFCPCLLFMSLFSLSMARNKANPD